MSILDKTHRPVRSTRQLLGVRCLADGCADTRDGLLAFFVIQPTNLNVLPQESVAERIHALLDVIKGMETVELLALGASESFAANRRFYHERLHSETLPALRRLLALYFEQDVTTTYFEETDGERWLAERGVQDEDMEQTESLVPDV